MADNTINIPCGGDSPITVPVIMPNGEITTLKIRCGAPSEEEWHPVPTEPGIRMLITAPESAQNDLFEDLPNDARLTQVPRTPDDKIYLVLGTDRFDLTDSFIARLLVEDVPLDIQCDGLTKDV